MHAPGVFVVWSSVLLVKFFWTSTSEKLPGTSFMDLNSRRNPGLLSPFDIAFPRVPFEQHGPEVFCSQDRCSRLIHGSGRLSVNCRWGRIPAIAKHSGSIRLSAAADVECQKSSELALCFGISGDA